MKNLNQLLLTLFALFSLSLSSPASDGISNPGQLGEDYNAIKALVMKQASSAMLGEGKITSPLTEYDFYSIVMPINILRTAQALTIAAEILPAEENCGCQDVFKVEMKLKKKAGAWQLIPGSLVINHIVIEH